MKTLRLPIEKAARTDLLCIHCNRFRAEYAINEFFGIHRACLKAARYHRNSKTQETQS